MSTIVVYIDAENAFDTINRMYLLYNLIRCGVKGELYKAINCIYLSSNCSITISDYCTDLFSTNAGVRQGNPLSSSLFYIYNDFVSFINANGNLGVHVDHINISMLIFVDDIVLIIDNEERLQLSLNRSYEWGKRGILSLMLTKVKSIRNID